ncbi:universal stress protein (plasmid) [Lichenicola cladoniae]|uniref:Universal stress protein n=1 Tax=Lichenicola cladoniae TaxID=1484109 RepID=A0A6M8HYY5_9PROT|nr:universal stress protein [Lichenicola cladoniae]NPD68193.1 universal stress protein [Acetobacteraceae bacterium]QKE93558.1 universal stress protein [Lichenicola cladoniae]
MTYSSLIVLLDPDRPNQVLLKVTTEVAELFGARVIGLVASHPLAADYGDSTRAGGMADQDYASLERRTLAVKAEFHTAMSGRVQDVQWRAIMTYEPPAATVAVHARAADLILSAPAAHGSLFGTARGSSPGDLVMQAGRPVLLVPPSASALDLERVVVGWKDTRETRRAVQDALPFLRKAGRVDVVELTEEKGLPEARLRLEDVAIWMRLHGVAADAEAMTAADSRGRELDDVAAQKNAGMLVIGAYGHKRMQEVLLGGATRDFLAQPGRCCLFSH